MYTVLLKVYFSSFSDSIYSSYLWLTDGRSLIKTKLSRLINVYLQVRSVTKKAKYWKYSVKVRSESATHGTRQQYGNKIMVPKCGNKIRYKFADTKMKWLMGCYYLSTFTRYCTFNVSYRKDSIFFCLIVLQTILFFAIISRGLYSRFVEEELCIFLGGSFCFDLLAILLLSVPIYVITFLWRITFL